MKRYSTNHLRKIADKTDTYFSLPQEVIKKYNRLNHPNPDGTQQPSGRAWIMWFLDEVDKKGNK